MSAGLLLFLLVCAVPMAWSALVYNRLVGLRNALRNAFAQIDVQLKRRHDLVPGLVEVAAAYLRHERRTLEAVVAARQGAASARASAAARPVDPRAIAKLDAAEALLSGAVGRLFAVVEAHPELKADETLSRLTEELVSTENRIAFARQAYNDTVTDHNVGIERFPNNLVAAGLGFRPIALLRATRAQSEREPVAVTLE
ncbi:MAG TPA: LemA family protein [Burkholderiaceae bacterium]|nr:LemA family protein [Burkholderiaceae bacterium]